MRGFTLLELTIVVIIVCLLAVAAIDKLLKARESAEWAAVTRNIGNLRSALGMQVAKHIVRGEMDAVFALAGSNPIDLAVSPPANYAGVQTAAGPADFEAQTWWFDPQAQALVYRIEFDGGFTSALDGPARVRFRIELFYEDRNGNGVFDKEADTFHGLDLVPVEPYTWRREPGPG